MKPTLNDILSAASTVFNVTTIDMLGPYTFKEYARPRQAVMFLAREMTSLSYPQIGRAMGNRDHTTAMWAVKATAARIASDSDWAPKIQACREIIHNTTNRRRQNLAEALTKPLFVQEAA